MGKARIATARKIAHLESDLHDIVKTGVGRSEAYDTLSVEIHGIGRPRSNQEAKIREIEELERATKERGERMVLNAGSYDPDKPKPGDATWCDECGGIHDSFTGLKGARLEDEHRGVHTSHGNAKSRHRSKTYSPSSVERLARRTDALIAEAIDERSESAHRDLLRAARHAMSHSDGDLVRQFLRTHEVTP